MKYKVYPLSITPFLVPSPYPSLGPFFIHISFIPGPSLSTINLITRPLIFFDFGALLLAVQIHAAKRELTITRTEREKKQYYYLNIEQCYP
jgi:hypothetical protein